ncbi:MAG: glycoside hydrolase family 15 protein [Actinomycetota bacterium]|nr:glycoside hydrolase family 15 protein [Actinomycetota bacterium]
MPETSIGDFGLLSDCQSAALVGRDGTVDWYCPERFDSPSVFARLLDEGGGHWSIRPTGPFETERAYLERTMVLRTEFRTPRGRVTLTDALAFGQGERGHEIGMRSPHVLLRRVEGLEGEVELALEFVPRLEYGLTEPLVLPTDGGVVVRGGPAELRLVSGRPLDVGETAATTRFTVRSGETADFALLYRRAIAAGDDARTGLDVGEELENTIEGWRSWSGLHRGYEGPYAEEVRRSALVLQALTYAPTGAVIAAATTSLPEKLGGDLNWDYRFAWLRDLSMTLQALWVAACPDEPGRFFRWVDRATGGRFSEDQHVQIMFGVEGERDLTEHTLDHLAGFRGSFPVRVGNDAWRQKQLDVLGEVVDSAHMLRDLLGEEFDEPLARPICSLADRAAERWREPDAGMWEARDKERHYLTSKVMCWVALDRAVELAPRLGGHANTGAWETSREEVREAILKEGWSEEAGAFTGAFGSEELDASVLMMPLVGFLPADDPRMRATVEKIERELMWDGLVHRWAGDGNGGFLICTYWLIECLALAGEVGRATELFERTNAYANDLGLLAEEADGETGELLGNFPQAFSHIGLVNAAWRLSQARDGRTS